MIRENYCEKVTQERKESGSPVGSRQLVSCRIFPATRADPGAVTPGLRRKRVQYEDNCVMRKI